MSIYLHFLDRELTASLNIKPDSALIQDILTTFLLMTVEPLYCGVSLILESCAGDEGLFKLMRDLMLNSVLLPVSSHPTLNEFLASRQIIYKHDQIRYPMYFNEKYYGPLLDENLLLLHKNLSTTTTLELELKSYIANEDKLIQVVRIDRLANPVSILNSLESGLEELGPKAVTFAAFHDHLPASTFTLESFALRRLISHEYSRHYISFLGADIITGLPGYSYYDYLAQGFPLFDFPIFLKLRHFFFAAISRQTPSDPFFGIIQVRGSPTQTDFVFKCRLMVRILMYMYLLEKKGDIDNCIAARNRILTLLREFILRTHPPEIPQNRNLEVIFQNAIFYLQKAMDLCMKDALFSEAAKLLRNEEHRIVTRILICTATDIETETFHSYARGKGISAEVSHYGSFSCFRFATVSNTEIYLVQS